MLSARTGVTAQEMARRVLVSSLVAPSARDSGSGALEDQARRPPLPVRCRHSFGNAPGVETLRRRGVPRGVGIAVHYLALSAIVGLLLLFAVPRALSEVQGAISSLPETRSQIHGQASQSTGLKREVLTGLERRLAELPSRDKLVEPGVEINERRGRGAGGHLLRLRGGGLLDVRAGSRRAGIRSLASQAQPRDRAEDMGAHRPEARRVRARTAAPHAPRWDSALPHVLGDRHAVLASRRGRSRASSRSSLSSALSLQARSQSASA